MKDGLHVLQRCINYKPESRDMGCLVKSFVFYGRGNLHILICLQQSNFETMRNHAILQNAREFNFYQWVIIGFFHSFMQLNKSRIGVSLEGSDLKDDNSAPEHIP